MQLSLSPHVVSSPHISLCPVAPLGGVPRGLTTSDVERTYVGSTLLPNLPRNLKPRFHPERPAGTTVLPTLDYETE